MNIDPGELDKKIKIVRMDEADVDDDGFPIKKSKVIRTCYAKFTNQSGSEIAKLGTEFSEAKARFLVRYSKKELATDMEIHYNGDRYDIKYINPYGDSREYIEIWCQCKERVGTNGQVKG